jgi:malonyl-ACP O-methyltransferase BioC
MIWRISKSTGSRPPIVFVPGWGFDGRVLGLARPPLSWHYPEGFVDPDSFSQELLGFLDREGVDCMRLAGWSMGAHLALDFARDYPERVAELFLFAMRHERPSEEIEAIRQEFAIAPRGFLASFYRKCFLGDRPHYQLFRESLEKDYLQEPRVEILHRGLDYLARARTLPTPVKTRLVHGRRDIVVALGERAELPGAELEIVEHAGHLVFLSPACSLMKGARKRDIRRHFTQAAATYDRHAGIQHEVARLLTDRLPSGPIASVLEAGCGTGSYTLSLAERFPHAEIISLDFSATMLDAAAGKLADRPNLRFQCEDAELFLDRASTHFDLVTSNATCHWFADLPAAVANISRLLTSSGTFLASIFGPATLEELRQGLSFLFDRPVALPAESFPKAEDLRRLLKEHFAVGELEEVRIIRRYQSLPALLHHIRNTGTAGWQEGPPPVFTRGRMRRLDDWFAEHCGGYRLTYQVFLVHAKSRKMAFGEF